MAHANQEYGSKAINVWLYDFVRLIPLVQRFELFLAHSFLVLFMSSNTFQLWKGSLIRLMK